MCKECVPVPHREPSRAYFCCGCGCGCGVEFREFLTLEEKVEILEEYKKQLQKEVSGVEKRILELKE